MHAHAFTHGGARDRYPPGKTEGSLTLAIVADSIQMMLFAAVRKKYI